MGIGNRASEVFAYSSKWRRKPTVIRPIKKKRKRKKKNKPFAVYIATLGRERVRDGRGGRKTLRGREAEGQREEKHIFSFFISGNQLRLALESNKEYNLNRSNRFCLVVL